MKEEQIKSVARTMCMAYWHGRLHDLTNVDGRYVPGSREHTAMTERQRAINTAMITATADVDWEQWRQQAVTALSV